MTAQRRPVGGRVRASHGHEQLGWLAGGAFAMGFGISSMHYTGMLAFRLPVPVLYHLPTVALSLLAAIVASAVAVDFSHGICPECALKWAADA
jgi:NO-binding membrane sensor protein with MHYT domain